MLSAMVPFQNAPPTFFLIFTLTTTKASPNVSDIHCIAARSVCVCVCGGGGGVWVCVCMCDVCVWCVCVCVWVCVCGGVYGCVCVWCVCVCACVGVICCGR